MSYIEPLSRYLYWTNSWEPGRLNEVSYEYCPIYYSESDSEIEADIFYEQKEICSTITYARNTFGIAARDFSFRAKLAQLAECDDWLSYRETVQQISLWENYQQDRRSYYIQFDLASNPGISAGISQRFATSEYKIRSSYNQESSEINYSVAGNNGKIPFKWNRFDLEIEREAEHENLTGKIKLYYPRAKEGIFDNRIYRNLLSINYQRKVMWEMVFQGGCNYEYDQAELYYNEERYGKLDKLEIISINAMLSKQISSTVRLTGGCKFARTRVGDDSYFDIWPFSYMDVLLSSRTRLKQADIEMYLPFMQIRYDDQYDLGRGIGLDFMSSLEYDHLFQEQEIVIKQRQYVLFPFFFNYQTELYDYSDEIDGYIILPLQFNLSWKSLRLCGEFQQLLPVKWSNLSIGDADKIKEEGISGEEWGGSWIRVSINGEF